MQAGEIIHGAIGGVLVIKMRGQRRSGDREHNRDKDGDAGPSHAVNLFLPRCITQGYAEDFSDVYLRFVGWDVGAAMVTELAAVGERNKSIECSTVCVMPQPAGMQTMSQARNTQRHGVRCAGASGCMGGLRLGSEILFVHRANR